MKENTMFAIRTILHPTDFSEQSEYAFRLTCALARDHGARVVLFHVAMPVVVAEGLLLQESPEEAKQKLWDAFHRLEKSDPKVRELRIETKLAEGEPATEILRAAQEIQPDLIVMGTHGRRGFVRLLMGSVAEAVLRKAPCPVLTVKAPVPSTPAPSAKHPEELVTV
jgi:nucleotide-binding universal stress UspA family protein